MTDAAIATHIARLRRLQTLADNYQAQTGTALMDAGQYYTLTAAISALEAQDAALPASTQENMRFGLLAERYVALADACSALVTYLVDKYERPDNSSDNTLSLVAAVSAELARRPV